MKTFLHTESKLIRTIQNIHQLCSTLLNDLLSEDENETEGEKPFTSIMNDISHKQPFTLLGLWVKYCWDILKLSIHTFRVSDSFKDDLQTAYTVDYHMPDIVHFAETLSWFHKLSFTDLWVLLPLSLHTLLMLIRVTEHHCTFRISNYIQYWETFISWINHILIHEIFSKRCLFVKVIRVKHSEIDRDIVLDLSMLRLSDDTELVSLSVLRSQKLYIVSVRQKAFRNDYRIWRGDQDLLHANYSIQFLWIEMFFSL